MVCQYCGGTPELVNGEILYGSRKLADKYFWLCRPCDAYVGCHPGTKTPLGTLADSPTRHARRMAHQAFDPLWKRKISRDKCSKGRARRAGYKWLAEQLGIPKEECHISWFDAQTCQRVVDFCKAVSRKQ